VIADLHLCDGEHDDDVQDERVSRKVMLTVTLFEGGDPAIGERRTMTIGRDDDAELATDVGRWAHDVTARMLAGDVVVDITDPDDDPPTPRPAVTAPGFVEQPLWPEP
jgi:hypothetical protein